MFRKMKMFGLLAVPLTILGEVIAAGNGVEAAEELVVNRHFKGDAHTLTK